MQLVRRFQQFMSPRSVPVWATIRNATRETTLANSAEVADTPARRKHGLLKRDGLEMGAGLWIVPCSGVHSFGMRFVFDVVYLDRKHRVRGVRTNMQPSKLSFCIVAHSALELPAGTVEATSTHVGDQVRITISEREPA